jgi:hypothetical protein
VAASKKRKMMVLLCVPYVREEVEWELEDGWAYLEKFYPW